MLAVFFIITSCSCRNDGIFVGPSAAMNVAGAVKVAQKLPAGSVVVTILCDGGDRYRTKLYNEEWLAERGLSPKHTGTSLAFIRDD